MGLCTPTLRSELLEELLNLNFHAYLQTVSEVLRRVGYEEVRLTGRTGFVGRNGNGGADIAAYRSVPGGRRAVLIQAKQFVPERPIYQRSVDELRGVVLRSGAAEGIFVTTSSFSDSVPTHKLTSAPIVPLRFIDGEYLAELMALYRVGVTKGPLPIDVSKGPYRIDKPFFARMESEFSGVARPLEPVRSVAYFIVGSTARKRRVK